MTSGSPTTVGRLLGALLLLWMLSPSASPAQALPPAFFQVAIDGLSGSFDDHTDLVHRGTAINTSLDLTGTDSHGFFSQFVGEANTTGGTRPMADVQGSATFAQGSATATVSYAFRATPVNAGIVAPGPIPVFMDAAGSVSVLTDPADVGDNAGRATFRIDEAADAFHDSKLVSSGPGFRGFGVFATVGEDGTAAAEFQTTFRLGLSQSGAIHGISLTAAGSTGRAQVGTSFEFQSVIDPVFRIDPNATFDIGGTPFRFADAYRLEFSEGVVPSVVPELSSLVLTGLGLIGLTGALAWRRAAQPVNSSA